MKWGGYRSQTAKKKAIVVVAHALVVIVWHVLATGKPYEELGADYFTSCLEPERRQLASPLISSRRSALTFFAQTGRPRQSAPWTWSARCATLRGWPPAPALHRWFTHVAATRHSH